MSDTPPADSHQTKPITGNAFLDGVLGFLFVVAGALCFCAGAMVPIVFYVTKRPRYPALCNGIGLGLVTLGVTTIVVLLVMIFRTAMTRLGGAH